MMASPYNLEIHDDCTDCPLRRDGRFCDLSDGTVAALNAAKFSTAYPRGATLFVEGETPRGVFILCSGRAKLTTSSSEGKTLIPSRKAVADHKAALNKVLDVGLDRQARGGREAAVEGRVD